MLLGDDDDDKGMMMSAAKDNGGNLLQQVKRAWKPSNTCVSEPRATLFPGFSWKMSNKTEPWVRRWLREWIALKITGVGGWVEIVKGL